MAKKYQLSEYRKSVEKTPFVLEVDDEGTTVEVTAPRGKNIMKLSKVEEGDLEGQLRLIAGDSFDALMAAIGDDSFEVMNAVLEDLLKHFGMDQGESNG